MSNSEASKQPSATGPTAAPTPVRAEKDDELATLKAAHARLALITPQDPPRFTPEAVNILGARWVVKLEFSETHVIGGLTTDPNERVMLDAPMAIVSLSWPLAKAVALLLAGVVADYEKEHGAITLPKNFARSSEK